MSWKTIRQPAEEKRSWSDTRIRSQLETVPFKHVVTHFHHRNFPLQPQNRMGLSTEVLYSIIHLGLKVSAYRTVWRNWIGRKAFYTVGYFKVLREMTRSESGWMSYTSRNWRSSSIWGTYFTMNSSSEESQCEAGTWVEHGNAKNSIVKLASTPAELTRWWRLPLGYKRRPGPSSSGPNFKRALLKDTDMASERKKFSLTKRA